MIVETCPVCADHLVRFETDRFRQHRYLKRQNTPSSKDRSPSLHGFSTAELSGVFPINQFEPHIL
jgi:hypothetical protein